MENYLVRDLMVPLSEYATVPEGSTLLDAALALEKAQKEFDHTKYTHRSILVLNAQEKVIGKLTFIDVISAVAPPDVFLSDLNELTQFGFSSKFIQHIYTQRYVASNVLGNLCEKAAELKVEEFMQTPTKGEYVEQNVPLRTAIHQLVIGNHLALLVTKGSDIIGILRLTDVFAAVFHTMKACEHSP